MDWYQKLLMEKRKLAIWGVGRRAEGVIVQLQGDDPNSPYAGRLACAIGANANGEWHGLPIRRLDEVVEWQDYFVILADPDDKLAAIDYLEERGLHEGMDYIDAQVLNRSVILGISAFYHDSAAALIIDGQIVAAAQEERFTRKKHDASFPRNAITWCMEDAGVSFRDLNAVVYYDNPVMTMDRLVQNIRMTGGDCEGLMRNLRMMLKDKLWIHRTIRDYSGGIIPEDRIFVCEHHISHAASAFYASPFEEAAVLTFDGVGEWATATIGIGQGNRLRLSRQMDYPHSLGLLYSAFTWFCGFRVNSGEYKLMGLAPYGRPIYRDLIMDKVVTIYDDGSLKLHLEYFDFQRGGNMTNDRFAALFGGAPRRPEAAITRREMDIAASIQAVTEEIVVRAARFAARHTKMRNLCLAGGTALNCVANGRLLREGIFDHVWIQPAASDAGGAIGAALYLYHHRWGNMRRTGVGDVMRGAYLGPEFDRDAIITALETGGYRYTDYTERENAFYQRIADELAENRVVGLFQGRMEFGPRALGNRSIIASPRSRRMQRRLNLKIKFRESFRPFAPSVLAEECDRYFDLQEESPYMLLTASVCEELRRNRRLNRYWMKFLRCLPGSGEAMLRRVNARRSTIPAVTHMDYSARIQTVTEGQNSSYYHIIKAFAKRTGCAVIVNTSFNVRGEPIVCTPEDALRCFMRTRMDVLVLGRMVLVKRGQPRLVEENDWRRQYALD